MRARRRRYRSPSQGQRDREQSAEAKQRGREIVVSITLRFKWGTGGWGYTKYGFMPQSGFNFRYLINNFPWGSSKVNRIALVAMKTRKKHKNAVEIVILTQN